MSEVKKWSFNIMDIDRKRLHSYFDFIGTVSTLLDVNYKSEWVSADHKLARELTNFITDETISSIDSIIKRELSIYPVTVHDLFDILFRPSIFKYSDGMFIKPEITMIDMVLISSIFEHTGIVLTNTIAKVVKEELVRAGRIDITQCIDGDYSLSVDTEKGENIKECDVETVVAEYTDVAISRIAEEMQNRRVKPGERIELVFDLYIFECTCVAFINDDCTTLKSMNLHLG